ncbi:hypothetical protein BDV96DRAFT_647642 [Lophiotrema nucula]|uniref:Uncharacterized protein n=1 Tax=Lophiotrema nucula TaxID=690887 RepID=A0A6A5Z559_9PLEO|nr:hypothetical protein BDV96DRAFT_647642 [Lophiotrema nucula]
MFNFPMEEHQTLSNAAEARRHSDPGLVDSIKVLDTFDAGLPATSTINIDPSAPARIQALKQGIVILTEPPPTLPTPSEDVLKEIEQRHEDIRDARDELLGLRFSLRSQRERVRKVRHKAGEEEGVLVDKLRHLLTGAGSKFPEEIEETLGHLVALRDELGNVEDDYDKSEEKYDLLEWEHTQKEVDFLNDLAGNQSSTSARPPTGEKTTETRDLTRHTLGPELPLGVAYDTSATFPASPIHDFLEESLSDDILSDPPPDVSELMTPIFEEERVEFMIRQTPSTQRYPLEPIAGPSQAKDTLFTISPDPTTSNVSLQPELRPNGSSSELHTSNRELRALSQFSQLLSMKEVTSEVSATRRRVDSWVMETLLDSTQQRVMLKEAIPQDGLDNEAWRRWVMDKSELETVGSEHLTVAAAGSDKSYDTETAPTSGLSRPTYREGGDRLHTDLSGSIKTELPSKPEVTITTSLDLHPAIIEASIPNIRQRHSLGAELPNKERKDSPFGSMQDPSSRKGSIFKNPSEGVHLRQDLASQLVTERPTHQPSSALEAEPDHDPRGSEGGQPTEQQGFSSAILPEVNMKIEKSYRHVKNNVYCHRSTKAPSNSHATHAHTLAVHLLIKVKGWRLF